MNIHKLLVISFTLCVACLTSTLIFGQNKNEVPLYLQREASIEKRVADLLSRMTLEEKVGQINVPRPRMVKLNHSTEFEGCVHFVKGTLLKNIGPGGGLKSLSLDVKGEVEMINKLQKIALEENRLKIPLLTIEEGEHGIMTPGCTVFPLGPSIGSTWNPDLIGKVYEAVAREGRAIGIHMICIVGMEPNRDPRLGRNEHAWSEDPYLCSVLAETIVKAVQGDDLSSNEKAITLLSHFPGQTQPESGLERGAMEVSERTLREIFLPSWVAAITKAGGLAVMATYPAIDGIPGHASKELLTDLLCNELGFKGVVTSEGQGFASLIDERVVENQKQAGELAIKAGVDISIWFEDGYLEPLIENVREGKVPVSAIDRAVKRMLTLKYKLGLFENPYVDSEHATKVINCPEHQDLALQVAREGIVLLKNEKDLLPLKKDLRSIAVIGPNADHGKNQLGDYSPVPSQEVITVLKGIKNKVSSKTQVTYVKGCNIWGSEVNEIREAVKAAKSADAAIVVIGESARGEGPGKPEKGTDGEGNDIASLDLTGLQQEMVEAVFKTGTPTIVVLINGRPLSTRWIAENVPSIIEAWRCGEKGGNAVADVLFGDYNPGGKLPVTIPRHVGQLPVFYNCKPPRLKVMRNEYWFKSYADMSALPLFPFGHGLSYTKFEYSDLEISPKETGPAGEIKVSLNVKNTGLRKGEETVQLYLDDVISSVVTPVIELKRFRKITLMPGEMKRVEFTINQEDMSFLNKHLEPVVEPGLFEVMVGSSSQDIRLKGTFEVKNQDTRLGLK